jgi:two-component system cell cycle sensor histidine kinase/response regulator CckA
MEPTTSPRAPTVLLVDDEAKVRQTARRMLEVDGYSVTEASSGFEAIELLSSGTPLDLLMADLDMPELGGIEMVRRIRETRPDLKILFVTGRVELLLETPRLWVGEAFLEKPFTQASLCEAVSLLLYGTVKKRE